MCPVFARDSMELHVAYCYHAYQICNCKKNKSITVDCLHALLHGRAMTFNQDRLSISVNYCLLLFYYYRHHHHHHHRRALLCDLFPRFFMLRANEVLVTSIGVLLSGCAMLYSMLKLSFIHTNPYTLSYNHVSVF